MKKLFLMAAIVLAVGSSFAHSSKNEKNLEGIQSMLLETKAELSPFCKAIVKGDVDAVQKLLALGVDVNEKSIGRTPAMYAARYNRVEILKLLIVYEADLKVKCSGKGLTALEYAKNSHADGAAELLEKAINS